MCRGDPIVSSSVSSQFAYISIVNWPGRHIQIPSATDSVNRSIKIAVAVPWEMYGPPPDCKQNLHRGWFGLLKCIRPVCGAKLLAIMESARRCSIKWVELQRVLIPTQT